MAIPTTQVPLTEAEIIAVEPAVRRGATVQKLKIGNNTRLYLFMPTRFGASPSISTVVHDRAERDGN